MKALLAVPATPDRQILQDTLAQYLIEVTIVSSEEEFFNAYSDSQPALAVLDLESSWLPKDGFNFFRRLRDHQKTTDYRHVILLASQQQHRQAANYLTMGANDLVYKPCLTELIDAKLRQLLIVFRLLSRLPGYTRTDA